jgi:hypothetical protein
MIVYQPGTSTEEDGIGMKDTLKVISEIYRYDTTGRITRSVTFRHNKIELDDTFIFDGKRLLESVACHRKKKCARTVYQYDSNDREIKSILYNRKGKMTDSVVNRYDSIGFLAGVMYYDKKGKLYYRNKYIVMSMEMSLFIMMISRTRMVLNCTSKKKYDSQNRVTEGKYYMILSGKKGDSMVLYHMSRYQYNQAGQMESTQLFDTNEKEIVQTCFIYYNEHSDIISRGCVNRYRQLSEDVSFDYIYDVHGNYTSVRTYYHDFLSSIRCVKIEYYE